MSKKRLKDEHKRFVVQCLARFMSPQEVADLVKEKFEVEITRQGVECYDPTKAAGIDLSAELRVLFFTERTEHGECVAAARLAHKAERVLALTRLAEQAEQAGNFRWASHLINQAREEIEGVQKGKPGDTGGKGGPKGSPVLRVTFEHDSGDTSPSQTPA